MKVMRKILVLLVASVIGFAGVANAFTKSENSDVFADRIVQADRVKSPPFNIPVWALCGQHWQMMRDSGWSEKDIWMADFIIHRESRCNPLAHNKQDPVTIKGVKGSLGLFQINLFWLSKTTAYPNGFLQTVLQRDLVPADLFDPQTNIDSAYAIVKYNRGLGGCGWTAWAWKGCK
jgi:hypothetical protein